MSFPLEDDPLLTGLENDSGLGTDGTPVDKAWLLAFAGLITEQVYDPLHPLVSPAELIDEIVDARGGFSFLDERLDGIDALIAAISIPSSYLGTGNLVINDDLSIWPENAVDASLPGAWQSSNTVVRSTTNIGAPNAASVTCSAFDTISFAQPIVDLIPAGSMLRGRAFSANVRVQCATGIGKVRLAVSDGVSAYYSAYNVGTTAETLTVSGAINPAATALTIRVESTAPGVVTTLVTCFTLVLSSINAVGWMPARQTVHEESFDIDATTLNATCEVIMPTLPTRLLRVLATGKTLDAATTLELEVEKYNENTAAWEALYTAPLAVIAGTVAGQGIVGFGGSGNVVPDGAYVRQCFGAAGAGISSGSHYQVLRARVSTADALASGVRVMFKYASFDREILEPNSF